MVSKRERWKLGPWVCPSLSNARDGMTPLSGGRGWMRFPQVHRAWHKRGASTGCGRLGRLCLTSRGVPDVRTHTYPVTQLEDERCALREWCIPLQGNLGNEGTAGWGAPKGTADPCTEARHCAERSAGSEEPATYLHW